MDVIPPGLDLQRYRAAGAVAHDAPIVLYVGRLKRYKGLDTVLRAFACVRDTVPAAQFVVVGKGDDLPRLKRLVRELGVVDSVRFEGFVSEDAKVDWLHRAHVLVYPSPKEGWGIATIEAAACGTPVLASDSEGLRDAVRDGSTGFLVPHSDAAAWAQRMTEILTDSALRQRLSVAGQQWARQFDWEAAADKMRTIIEEVAVSSGGARRVA